MNQRIGFAALSLTALVLAGFGIDPLIGMFAGETSSSPGASDSQVLAWRRAGPTALATLLVRYDALADGDEKIALAGVIDRVAAQKYAHVSRLYWYTDIDEAEADARATGRPILSLRLLGRLDEDLSCANSRFFRVALYADADLSGFLRDRFVLHWSSERAAPRVTIDFGDGRVLERTVGGNSVHYVLDAAGRPVDALPGLWGPAAFRRALEAALPAAQRASTLDGAQRARFLAGYHRDRLAQLRKSGSQDLPVGMDSSTLPANGTILEAERRSLTKVAYEGSLVRTLRLGPQVDEASDDSPVWQELGARRAADARLDAQSKALMRKLTPTDWSLDARPLDSESFEAMVAAFESRIAADTAMNESAMHARIHSWLSSDDAPATLPALNERVYTELFLTPASDPWLGMATRGVFSGLPSDGIVASTRTGRW